MIRTEICKAFRQKEGLGLDTISQEAVYQQFAKQDFKCKILLQKRLV